MIRPYINIDEHEAGILKDACRNLGLCLCGLCLCDITNKDLSSSFRNRGLTFDALQASILANGLSSVSESQMRRDVSVGSTGYKNFIERIRNGSIRYKRRDNNEHWQTYIETMTLGYGDCEDLASIYAACLRFLGWDSGAYVAVYKALPGLYHVITMSAYGPIDPSRLAGMGKE